MFWRPDYANMIRMKKTRTTPQKIITTIDANTAMTMIIRSQLGSGAGTPASVSWFSDVGAIFMVGFVLGDIVRRFGGV